MGSLSISIVAIVIPLLMQNCYKKKIKKIKIKKDLVEYN